MQIAVAGIGYVGLSSAILLARHHTVIATDVSRERVDAINARRSPITDPEVIHFLANENLDLTATTNPKEAYAAADFIIVATPTNYDEKLNTFDTSSVESVIETALFFNPSAIIIIKSTVPVGFIRYIRRRLDTDQIIFSPEFLREGRALYDNLYPSRIVVGSRCSEARRFDDLLLDAATQKEVPVLFTDPDEAEAIKLCSNT